MHDELNIVHLNNGIVRCIPLSNYREPIYITDLILFVTSTTPSREKMVSRITSVISLAFLACVFVSQAQAQGAPPPPGAPQYYPPPPYGAPPQKMDPMMMMMMVMMMGKGDNSNNMMLPMVMMMGQGGQGGNDMMMPMMIMMMMNNKDSDKSKTD